MIEKKTIVRIKEKANHYNAIQYMSRHLLEKA